MALKSARNHTQKHPLVSGSPYWQGVELHVSAQVYCIMVKSLSLSRSLTHTHIQILQKNIWSFKIKFWCFFPANNKEKGRKCTRNLKLKTKKLNPPPDCFHHILLEGSFGLKFVSEKEKKKKKKEKRSQYRSPDFVLHKRGNIIIHGFFCRLKFFLMFEYTDVIYIFLFFSTFTLNTQPNGNQEVKKNDFKKKKEIQEVKKQ